MNAEAEVVEGTAVEIVPEVRSVAVIQQPGQALVNETGAPAAMVAVATALANALKSIVENQRLYAVIQGKKYPTVEAWMTIARLDNVVAREARPPVRNDDGSYEAFAELIRLSDGMVIGAASALCGGPDDEPWGGTPAKYGKPAKGPRPEHARRSMASTRAISRAFRAQYSWIMALAGYEPTPSDEMPPSDSPAAPVPSPVRSPAPAGASTPGGSGGNLWRGPVSLGQAPVDGLRRQTPEGSSFGFVLTDQQGKRIQVLALGPMADALALACADGLPDSAEVDGDLVMVPWEKKQDDGTLKKMPTYRRVIASRITTPDFTVPAAGVAPVAAQGKPDELDDLAW